MCNYFTLLIENDLLSNELSSKILKIVQVTYHIYCVPQIGMSQSSHRGVVPSSL